MTPKKLGGSASVPVKKRILEVSDEKAFRAMTAAILENRGFEVVQASQGPEALNFYRECGAFAAVLTDLYWYDEVPEPPFRVQRIRDGIQLALAIRELDPEQKILIHTGNSELARKQMPEKLGDVLILQKPYPIKDLILFLDGL